jgi:hypothetical protein
LPEQGVLAIFGLPVGAMFRERRCREKAAAGT